MPQQWLIRLWTSQPLNVAGTLASGKSLTASACLGALGVARLPEQPTSLPGFTHWPCTTNVAHGVISGTSHRHTHSGTVPLHSFSQLTLHHPHHPIVVDYHRPLPSSLQPSPRDQFDIESHGTRRLDPAWIPSALATTSKIPSTCRHVTSRPFDCACGPRLARTFLTTPKSGVVLNIS